jgi:N-acetylneuraminic acid mutarotase
MIKTSKLNQFGNTSHSTIVLLTYMFLILAALIYATGCSSQQEDLSSMSVGRWSHSATLLDDGRVLIVGGKERPYGSVPSTEIFDPTNNSWSSAGNTLKPRGEGHTAILLNNGQVLITGGTEDGSSELYDPDENKWLYADNMMEPRKWASATLLPDGKVIIVGGDDSSRSGSKELDSAEIYNPSTNKWSLVNNMNHAHSGHSATMINNKLLIIGKDSAELFDPLTGVWSLTGNPVRARSTGSTATTIANGKVLVTGGEWHKDGTRHDLSNIVGSAASVGGSHGGPTARHRLTTVELLDHAELHDYNSGTWRSTNKMSEGRSDHVSILTNDGKVVIIGSYTLEEFDPKTQNWSEIGSLANNHGQSYTATLITENKILIVGGKQDSKTGIRGITDTEIFEMPGN